MFGAVGLHAVHVRLGGELLSTVGEELLQVRRIAVAVRVGPAGQQRRHDREAEQAAGLEQS